LAATLVRGACQVERRKTEISEAVLSLALPHSEAEARHNVEDDARYFYWDFGLS